MRPVQGFVKLAIQHGAVIATGYCFGNTSILRVHTDPFGVLKWLSRTLRVSLVMISAILNLRRVIIYRSVGSSPNRPSWRPNQSAPRPKWHRESRSTPSFSTG